MTRADIQIRSAPDFLQFYPTLRCNMNCSFCFNRNMEASLNASPDTTLTDFGKMVRAASSAGIGHIDFLGGEPTLHPDIESLIRMAQAAGVVVTLSSNGTRPDVLERLSLVFPATVLRIGISINTDRIGEKLMDYIRRSRPIVKTLFASEADVMQKPFFSDPADTETELRVIYPDAVDRQDLAHCMPFDAYYQSLDRLSAGRPNLRGVFCEGFLPAHSAPASAAGRRCPAGTTKLSVLPGGDVYPCYLLFHDSRFRLGNLLEDDFSKIWENPLLDSFREPSSNRCPRTGCPLFNRCRGGCPAVSHRLNGSLSGPDPRCINDHFG